MWWNNDWDPIDARWEELWGYLWFCVHVKISRLLCCLINPKLLIADVYVCTDCLSPASNITLFIWICFEQSERPESTANGYDHSVTSLDGRVTHRVTQVLSHWFVEPGTVHCTHMASSHQISAQRSTFSHWGFIPLKLGLYWEVLGFQLGLGCPKNIKNILVETVGLCVWTAESPTLLQSQSYQK